MNSVYNINGLNFRLTRKKEYDVYICRPKLNTKVYNKLEGSYYVTDKARQFVVSGTVGENWVIDVGVLMRTYRFINGKWITVEELKKRLNGDIIDWMKLRTITNPGEEFFAANLPLQIRNFPVQTPWGDTLLANRDGVQHGHGDFIVSSIINGGPNLQDLRVVNGNVFPNTYDMRAFPSKCNTGRTHTTPVPKSLLKIYQNVK